MHAVPYRFKLRTRTGVPARRGGLTGCRWSASCGRSAPVRSPSRSGSRPTRWCSSPRRGRPRRRDRVGRRSPRTFRDAPRNAELSARRERLQAPRGAGVLAAVGAAAVVTGVVRLIRGDHGGDSTAGSRARGGSVVALVVLSGRKVVVAGDVASDALARPTGTSPQSVPHRQRSVLLGTAAARGLSWTWADADHHVDRRCRHHACRGRMARCRVSPISCGRRGRRGPRAAISSSVTVSMSLRPVWLTHVERVEHERAHRVDVCSADVEVELGECRGDAEQHANAVDGLHVDHGCRVGHVVVERDRGTCVGRRLRAALAAACAFGCTRTKRGSVVERAGEVVADALPVRTVTEGIQHGEHDSARPVSSEKASAAVTSRPWSASTPAMPADLLGRSSATRWSVSSLPPMWVPDSASARSCSAVGKGRTPSAWSSARASSPLRSIRSVRSTRSATRRALAGPDAVGPVASESASVSAVSSDSMSTSPTSVATCRIVAGSSRSRRVATSDRSRWCSTRRHATSTSLVVEAHPFENRADEWDAEGDVVAARGALADVVQ